MIQERDIKIENGKITTFVSERCTGMSTLLCQYAADFLKNNDKKVLIVSHTALSAKHTCEILLSIIKDKARVDYMSINEAFHKMCFDNYEIIIYDCPDIMNEDNVLYINFLSGLRLPKIIIGITWENIAFDKDINKIIRRKYVNLSNYSYFFSHTCGDRKLFYEIKNDIIDDLIEDFYGFY